MHRDQHTLKTRAKYSNDGASLHWPDLGIDICNNSDWRNSAVVASILSLSCHSEAIASFVCHAFTFSRTLNHFPGDHTTTRTLLSLTRWPGKTNSRKWRISNDEMIAKTLPWIFCQAVLPYTFAARVAVVRTYGRHGAVSAGPLAANTASICHALAVTGAYCRVSVISRFQWVINSAIRTNVDFTFSSSESILTLAKSTFSDTSTRTID